MGVDAPLTLVRTSLVGGKLPLLPLGADALPECGVLGVRRRRRRCRVGIIIIVVVIVVVVVRCAVVLKHAAVIVVVQHSARAAALAARPPAERVPQPPTPTRAAALAARASGMCSSPRGCFTNATVLLSLMRDEADIGRAPPPLHSRRPPPLRAAPRAAHGERDGNAECGGRGGQRASSWWRFAGCGCG